MGEGPAAEARRRLVAEAGGIAVSEPGPEVRLAFVAIEAPAAAEAAASALRARGLLVNVADRPALCDFFVPAIVDRAPVAVAIGTGGASAGLARALKERLEILLPSGLGRLARALGSARARLGPGPAERRARLAALLAPGGALDPLAEHPDPEAVLAALGEGPGAAKAEPVVLRLDLPEDPEDLPLRSLRLLQQADTLVLEGEVPAAVLALARRDARRLPAPADPPPPGRTLILRPARQAGKAAVP